MPSTQQPQEIPSSHHLLLESAVKCHEAGDDLKAESLCRLALAADPDNANLLYFLGTLALQRGHHDVAVDYMARSARSNPQFCEAFSGLGDALKALGQWEEAIASYRRALNVNPRYVTAYTNLGNLFRERKDPEAAIDMYRAAIAIEPDSPEVRYNLSIALMDLGRDEEAENICRQIIRSHPQFHLAYMALHCALGAQERYAESLRALQNALENSPEPNVDILRLLATGLEGLDETEAALRCYKVIGECLPDDWECRARVIDMALTLCKWDEYKAFAKSLVRQTHSEMEAGVTLTADIFNLQALPVSYRFIAKAARAKSKVIARRALSRPSRVEFARPRTDDGMLRIGYVLPYTWFHSLPFVLKGVIERHDRNRFEVFGYSIQKGDDSDFDKAYRGAFDHFADLPRHSPEFAAQRINEDGIQVLIDVTGHTQTNCLDVVAYRPAPVQGHFLGYSITTGADFIDYLITDRNYIPKDMRDNCSEKLVYMPETFMATTRAPIAEGTVTRADYDLPEDGIVFCNFNHPCKFEPRSFSLWMRLLDAIPGSVLWLGLWKNSTCTNLRREAKARGIEEERLIFTLLEKHPEHCRRLRLADLALDTYYHGGGITTVDALWCGVPVLTALGKTPSARLGASLSLAAGLPDLVVSDLQAYERTALELARDPERLAGIRRKLWDNRLTSPLFDTDRYTRHLEAAFEAMWDVYASGEAPRHIDVPAQADAHADA